MHMEHFFLQIQVKTKKKGLIKNTTLFLPIFAHMYIHSNYWGDTAKLLGRIYLPHPPVVSAPLPGSPLPIAKFWLFAKRMPRLLTFQSTISLSHKNFLFRKFLMTSLHDICGLPPLPNKKLWLRSRERVY